MSNGEREGGAVQPAEGSQPVAVAEAVNAAVPAELAAAGTAAQSNSASQSAEGVPLFDPEQKASWQQTQEAAQAEPVFKDEYFRKKPKKHGREWKIVDSPAMFVPVADTHAHLDMLAEPALALARAAVHKVGFVEAMVDPAEDPTTTFEKLDEWRLQAEVLMRSMSTRICGQGHNSLPRTRIAVGVHPHKAEQYDSELEALLLRLMHDPRVSAVGEIGLDYHYDYSPRDVQRSVFERQVRLAQEAEMPVILHVREAFDDAFDIMQGCGWNDAGVLLHCYTSDESEIGRWSDAGCYVAFGGAFTFKKLEGVRAAAREVPRDRLLTETDAPFMTPEPFRGASCEPAHVIFTAERMFNFLERDDAPGDVVFSGESDEQRRAFFTQTYQNAVALLDRPPTNWQDVKGAR